MSAAARPLADLLPRLDARLEALRSAAIAALNGQSADDLRVMARAPDAATLAATRAWIAFDAVTGVVAVAPLIAAGAVARLAPDGSPDGLAAAACLEAIEPLVGLVELALARPLYPRDVTTASPEGAALVELIATEADGFVRHRLLLALSLDAGLEPAPPRRLAPPAGLRLSWRADFAGPKVRRARLATIGTGDLILLGASLPLARLNLPGRPGAVPAAMDASITALTLCQDQRQGGPMLNETETLPPDASEPTSFDWTDASVETVIELPSGTIAAGDLAGLAAGSTLPLPTTGGTLAVKVSAGGLHVADGQLVALGEGYAVLVTAVADRG